MHEGRTLPECALIMKGCENLNQTMINEQRKKFRQWAREEYRNIENAPDLETALAAYAACMAALRLVSIIFPDEPLELTRGNLRVYLEQHFDDYVEKIK